MTTSFVWVVSFSVLGTVPEHGTFGTFGTKAECLQALEQKKQQMQQQKKDIVGTCYYTNKLVIK